MKKDSHKKSPVCVFFSTLGTSLLIILIIICIPFTLPRLMDYRAYTVISGSMEPQIPVGSIVYVKSIEPENVQKKDVIAYYGGRDANAIITHRVVENRVVMGEFITKGDANQTEDMNPVDYQDLIGRVELCIPKVGILAQFLTDSRGKLAAGCMIGMAVILHLLASLCNRAGR